MRILISGACNKICDRIKLHIEGEVTRVDRLISYKVIGQPYDVGHPNTVLKILDTRAGDSTGVSRFGAGFKLYFLIQLLRIIQLSDPYFYLSVAKISLHRRKKAVGAARRITLAIGKRTLRIG